MQKIIDGVIEKKLIRNADDRGFFMEILRDDDPFYKKFGQSSMSVTYPGVIKAFHYHKLQDDLWFFPSGNAQVVLYDNRKNSDTYKQTNIFYLGEHNYSLVVIPKGVLHGYKVLGSSPATLVYYTTEHYNPENPDEYRIEFDDPEINFDWETKNR